MRSLDSHVAVEERSCCARWTTSTIGYGRPVATSVRARSSDDTESRSGAQHPRHPCTRGASETSLCPRDSHRASQRFRGRALPPPSHARFGASGCLLRRLGRVPFQRASRSLWPDPSFTDVGVREQPRQPGAHGDVPQLQKLSDPVATPPRNYSVWEESI